MPLLYMYMYVVAQWKVAEDDSNAMQDMDTWTLKIGISLGSLSVFFYHTLHPAIVVHSFNNTNQLSRLNLLVEILK